MNKNIALVSLLALYGTPALAQSSPDDEAPAQDTIVITATRSGDAIPASLIGSSVTVIGNDALQARQTRYVVDVLRDVPGVAVNRGIGGVTEVRIRGSEVNHALVFVDGIKSDNPAQAQFDYATLLNDEYSRVEVLRGQQSSLYGSDAIGGVITYTTLDGREAPGFSARAEGGSMGTYAGGARAAGAIGDTLDMALSGTFYHTDGYAVAPGGTDDVEQRSAGVTGKVNWTPASNFKLTAVGRYSYLKADLTNQDISAASPIVQSYPLTIAVDSPGNFTESNAFYGLIGASWDLFDGAWTNAATAAITDDNRDYAPFNYGTRGRRYRTTFSSTVRFGNDRWKNRFTAAVDYERQEFRNLGAEQHVLHTYGYVLNYDMKFDERLAISASARIDDYNLFGDAATYRATASYMFPSGTRVHAAYGTGIKAPTPFELYSFTGMFIGNPALQPEKSRGWEAGVEQNLLDGAVTLGATYFRNRLTDEIGSTFLPSGSQTAINRPGSALQRGVETYVNAKLGEFRLDATYTYLDAPRQLSTLVGNAPVDGSTPAPVLVQAQGFRRAKHIASLNFTYEPEALPLRATLTVRYNGEQNDNAFTASFRPLLVTLPAYTIINFNAAYDINPHMQIFGRVENLADDRYQEVFGYDSPGRAVYAGARVKF